MVGCDDADEDDDDDDDDDTKSVCEKYSGTSAQMSSWILANATTIWVARIKTVEQCEMRSDIYYCMHMHSTAYRLGEFIDLIGERRYRAGRDIRMSDRGRARDNATPRIC